MYPGWANGIGWLIAMTAILSVPIAAIVTVVVAYRKRPEEGLLAAFNRFPASVLFARKISCKLSKHCSDNLPTGRKSTLQSGGKMLPRRTGQL